MQALKTKGFTLLELLVVIVLLGIVSSFAMLSLNITGLESELDEEARKIHALIMLAKEDAIIQAQEVALKIDKQTYYFEYWDGDKEAWIAKTEKVFRQRKLHDGLTLRLESEAKKLFVKSNNNSKSKDDIENGTVYFLSSGEQSEFTIKIAIKDEPQVYYQLEGKLTGDVKIEKQSGFE